MNLHDSERIESRLRELGMEAVTGAADADLVLLNTCSVRDKPVQKIVSRIGELAKATRLLARAVTGRPEMIDARYRPALLPSPWRYLDAQAAQALVVAAAKANPARK